MKKKKKSLLETLTYDEIEEITRKADEKPITHIIKNEQVNMRVSSTYLKRIQTLADIEGIPCTTFLKKLLMEDIDRLWSIHQKYKAKTKKTST
jgi:predicted DNA binding CopG/RHH family protein